MGINAQLYVLPGKKLSEAEILSLNVLMEAVDSDICTYDIDTGDYDPLKPMEQRRFDIKKLNHPLAYDDILKGEFPIAIDLSQSEGEIIEVNPNSGYYGTLDYGETYYRGYWPLIKRVAEWLEKNVGPVFYTNEHGFPCYKYSEAKASLDEIWEKEGQHRFWWLSGEENKIIKAELYEEYSDITND